MPRSLPPIRSLITAALYEDRVHRDVTTDSLFPKRIGGSATISAKENCIVAGLEVAKQVFQHVDHHLLVTTSQKDGDAVQTGTSLCTIVGDARSVLKAERVALNFFQRLSGIATLTHQYCHAIHGLKTKILDTRKTTPGLRALEKWAVSIGGGHNHRQSLEDAILIKDNHVVLLKARGITGEQACRNVRKRAPRGLTVCIEAETLTQVRSAIKGKPDIILLDNMSPETVQKAVHLIQERALIEVSGGITLKNVRQMAEAGPDFISIGALTHSARAVDMSLTLKPDDKAQAQRPRRSSR